MKNDKVIKNVRRSPPNMISRGFIGAAILLAFAGIWAVFAFYNGDGLLLGISHFPFWMMIGLIGLLLNYLPIARSKPPLIPVAGMATVAGTVLWFCCNNFIELDGLWDVVGRLKVDLILLVLCYCLTHMSLLMLTYSEHRSDILLILTCVAVLASGLGYVAIFSGSAPRETRVFILLAVACLFFIKFGLTVATIVHSLQSTKTESQSTNEE